MIYTAHYDSPLGGMTLTSDGTALTALDFNGQNYAAEESYVHPQRKGLPVFEETCRWLDLYFDGSAPDFLPPLALSGTPFQQAVWAILQTIPYGTTTTYGAIAKRLTQDSGKRMAAQAVGGAVGRNPISILVPCHRVIGADGSLTGYAGGLERKEYLLRLEGGYTCYRHRRPSAPERCVCAPCAPHSGACPRFIVEKPAVP